jgi:hypothetical protein
MKRYKSNNKEGISEQRKLKWKKSTKQNKSLRRTELSKVTRPNCQAAYEGYGEIFVRILFWLANISHREIYRVR